MKICLVGTHGTGKSTFSYILGAHYKKKGKNVKIIQEVARNCPFPLNSGMTKQACLWIYHYHILKEIEYESKSEILICDRSYFDCFIYSKYFKINLGDHDYLIQAGHRNLSKEYDKIIFIRPDIPIQEDGFRSTDKNFQKGIDKLFVEILDTIPHTVIPSSEIFHKDNLWTKYFS